MNAYYSLLREFILKKTKNDAPLFKEFTSISVHLDENDINSKSFYLTGGFNFIFLRQKADGLAPEHTRQFTTLQVFYQVERRFHIRELNRQPLPWDLGISPPSSNCLGSHRTNIGAIGIGIPLWIAHEFINYELETKQSNPTYLLRRRLHVCLMKEMMQLAINPIKNGSVEIGDVVKDI